MANKTYDGAEILQMKPQPVMNQPPPRESIYEGGAEAYRNLGLKPSDGRSSDSGVSAAHETDRLPFRGGV